MIHQLQRNFEEPLLLFADGDASPWYPDLVGLNFGHPNVPASMEHWDLSPLTFAEVSVPVILEHSGRSPLASLSALTIIDVNAPATMEHSNIPPLAPTTLYIPQTVTPTLGNLPAELHLKIFEELDRVTSTCLGLTNKKFYPIHKSLHGHVPLLAHCLLPPQKEIGRFLFTLLKRWMKKQGLLFSLAQLQFITPERRRQLKEEASKLTWNAPIHENRTTSEREKGQSCWSFKF